MVDLRPGDQHEGHRRGEHDRDADQQAAVLPPGDPQHSPPQHGPRSGAGVPSRLDGPGEDGHRLVSIGSV